MSGTPGPRQHRSHGGHHDRSSPLDRPAAGGSGGTGRTGQPGPAGPAESADPSRRSGRAGRSRRRSARRGARLTLLGAASAALVFPLLPGPQATAGQPGGGTLENRFTEAAERYDVPREVLMGVAYLQSRWDTHEGAPSVSGGYGPMHLTDARTALNRSAGHHHPDGDDDARGDTRRPAQRTASAGRPADGKRAGGSEPLPARLRTLERAAGLTGLPRERLRDSAEANILGGAALLADAQRRLGHRPSADPADWYDAVAAYPGGGRKAEATAFADDVFDVLREGARRTTDTGETVTLPARPGLTAADSGARGRAARGPECPRTVDCEWLPSPYEKYKNDQGEEDYGNHDRTRRPGSQRIDHIVIHDTEETWEKSLRLVQDPEYVSWNYTLRASDGHIAQHVRAKDTAWHAGNWYINSTSVGLEHEGFLADPDAWYTEAMYRSSARLVRYLADRYDIPLDRQHVLGHDNVPGTTPSAVKGMHTDPGPYWDWDHYFRLLGKPFVPHGGPRSKLVTIRPDYATNRPPYTGCETKGEPCRPHGSGAVRLHSAPDASSPLVKDIGLRPDGSPSTTDVNDVGARASTGQQYAVAGRKGDWTAVWYLGQKAWFRNPRSAPAAVPARGTVAEPRPGAQEIPVYGRAYPEKSAYPKGVPAQELTPLPYTVRAGQRYVVGGTTHGAYLYASGFDPDASGFRVVRGKQRYYQIQLGHRVAFVKAEDVRLVNVR